MFQKLHEQAMAKMSLTFIITASKAEKFQKPKWSIPFETPSMLNDFVSFVLLFLFSGVSGGIKIKGKLKLKDYLGSIITIKSHCSHCS